MAEEVKAPNGNEQPAAPTDPTQTNGAQPEQQPDVKIPLTFGRWFFALIISKLFMLIPVGIWAVILGYLIYTDGPKNDAAARLYDMFQRLYSLMGFFIFVLVGFGWRIAAGRARGKGTMISSALMGTLIVLLCNFAHFYIMDYKFYPFASLNTRASIYKDWAASEFNVWAEQHNDWVRSGETERTIEVVIAVDNKSLAEHVETNKYKKWYYEDHDKWVELKNSLIPAYNKWAEKENKPLWTPSKPHRQMPKTLEGFVKDIPQFAVQYPQRLQEHMKASKKAGVIIGISWVIWLCGFFFGGLWITRTYVSKEETKRRQAEARAALAAAKKANRPPTKRPHAAEKKDEGQGSKPEEGKEQPEQKSDDSEKKEESKSE